MNGTKSTPEHVFEYIAPRLTQLELAVRDRIEASDVPVITPYQLFLDLQALYQSGEKLRLRRERPNHEDLGRRRRHLIAARVLVEDPDYVRRAYRIVSNGDATAEDICCIVDRFAYVSHLSAMALYGLTNRRSRALHLSSAHQRIAPQLIKQAMESDYGAGVLNELQFDEIQQLHNVSHPKTVRKRPVEVFRTNQLLPSMRVQGTRSRVVQVGHVFVDMLETPEACGGMRHVLEVWEEHARTYLSEIVDAIDSSARSVTKVRAGYILDERLGFNADERILGWKKYAQRGGSRVLDPSRSFASPYSERWMLSLNVS